MLNVACEPLVCDSDALALVNSWLWPLWDEVSCRARPSPNRAGIHQNNGWSTKVIGLYFRLSIKEFLEDCCLNISTALYTEQP